MTTKTQPVCRQCGSDDVLKDAYACWNVETQEWELLTTFDEFVCEKCEGPTQVEFIEGINNGII